MQPVSVGVLKQNGMRFYAHFDRIAHVSGIGVRCGSLYDPRGKRGMAHAVEHAITRRSQRYTQRQVSMLLWKFLGRPDDRFMIQTDWTSTFYGHDSLLRKEHMLQVFDVMASFVRDQVVEQEIRDSEWAAVHQEYFLRGIDDMEDLLEALMHEIIYTRNPARNRIDCEPDELRTITVQEARQFILRHYVPNNMFVILLGPSYKEAKRLVRRHFSDWSPGIVPTLEYDKTDDVPILTSVKSATVTRPGIHQYHVAIGFPTETYLSKDAETLDVLARILEIRLYEKLRLENHDFEKGAYRVYVITRRTFAHGLLFVHFATASREFAEEGREVVIREMERLKQDFAQDDERDAAIGNLDLEYLDDLHNTPGQLANRIIEAASNGDERLIHLHAFRDSLHRVGKKRILSVANKYFTPNHVHVVISPE